MLDKRSHLRFIFRRNTSRSLRQYLRAIGILAAHASILVNISFAQDARWYQLSQQVVQLKEQGRIAEAIPVAQQVVHVAETTYGPNDRHLGLSLNVLGVLLSEQEKFTDAEATLQRALAIMSKASGAESRDVASVLGNLGDLYRLEGHYPNAAKFTEQALHVHEKVSGPDDPAVAVQAVNLASVFVAQNKYSEAEPLYRRAIAIDQKQSADANRDLPPDLSGLGDLYLKEGKYPEAEPLFVNALSLDLKVLGKDHPQIALDLSNLGAAYMYEGKFSLAEPVLQRAQAIVTNANQLNSSTEVQILRGTAALYRHEGKYSGAEAQLLQAISTRAKAVGSSHPDIASILRELAQVYQYESRYGDSERAYRQALTIDLKALGPDNLTTAEIMVDLATLYGSHGLWGQADRLYHDAIPLYLKILGQADERLGDLVFSASQNLLAESKFEEAANGFKAAAAIYLKAKGESSTGLAHCYDNMAAIAEDGGNSEVAEKLHKQALAILEKALGPDSSGITSSLGGLARIYKEQQRFADAERLYLRALKIDQANFQPNDPGLRDDEADLAALYYVWGKPQQADPYFQAYLKSLMDEFRANASTMSERDRLIYFGTQRNAFPLFFSFVLKFHQQMPELSGQMYDALLLQKGLIAESAAAMRSAVASSGDKEAVAMLDKLAADKAQLAALSESTAGNPANHAQQSSQIFQEANALEQSLMKRSAALSQQKTLNGATWQEVQKALQPGEVAIEVTKFQFHNGIRPTASQIYVGLIVTPDCTQPIFVLLGEAKDLEAGPMMAYRAEVGQMRGIEAESEPAQQSGAADTSATYAAFWKPMEPALNNARRVYVAPDGVLNTIPIGLMADTTGKFLMEKYQLRIVNSTRDILRASRASQTREAVLVGNPTFNLTADQERTALARLSSGASTPANLKTVAMQSAPSSGPVHSQPIASRGGDLKGGDLNPLPGTELEVQIVDKLLNAAGWKNQTYMVDLALKQAVTRAHGPRLLHIATHGFFLTDEQLTATAAAQGRKVNLDVDPMLRSGLFFAGADRARAGDASVAGVDDGVLTAYEASQLSLEGTELVVLSACETGLGKELNSDGVFGLRRGLQVAGAEAVMMSMWSVPDRETQELMALFYAKWLGGLDKSEALRQAQLEEREVVRKRYGKDLPYYWGAFVLVGR